MPTAGARVHLQIAGSDDTDRALLRTLHRVGVSGATALSVLVATSDLITRVRQVEEPGPVDLDIAADAAVVRIDIDITAHTGSLAALISTLARFADSPSGAAASRWGTIHDSERSAVWTEVDRIPVGGDPKQRRHAVETAVEMTDPVHLLLDVTSRLSR